MPTKFFKTLRNSSTENGNTAKRSSFEEKKSRFAEPLDKYEKRISAFQKTNPETQKLE